MGKILIGLLAGISLWGASQAEALTVTPSSDSAVLAGTLEGGGISIWNAQYTGASEASGWFSDWTDIGFSKGGVILATGKVSDAPLPLENYASTGNGGGSGSGFDGFDSTDDFAFLKFDFTTSTGNLFFNYRFASEEVSFWDDDLHMDDKIRVLIDGAQVLPFGSFVAAVEGGFLDGGSLFTTYDGITDVLTSRIAGLGTGPHTLEIGIADFGDDLVDSAFFIGPLSATAPVPEPSTFALLGLGLGGVIWSARRKKRS